MISLRTPLAATAAGLFAIGMTAAVASAPTAALAEASCKCFQAATIATDCATMDKRSVENEPFGTMSGSRALTCAAEGKGKFQYIAVQQGATQFTCAYYTPKINNAREALNKESYDACLAEIETAKPGLGIE